MSEHSRRANRDRRLPDERRSGTDKRPEHEKHLVGERRSGMDRRSAQIAGPVAQRKSRASYLSRLFRDLAEAAAAFSGTHFQAAPARRPGMTKWLMCPV